MSKAEKRLERLKSLPKDYEWDELVALLKSLGFVQQQRSGSRVSFYHPNKPNVPIKLHEPHNVKPKVILMCYLKQVCETLTEMGFIK